MKTSMKLFGLVIMAFSLVLTSCDGEDGEDGAMGLQGEQGIAGVDGEDGANGENGEDGNANVIASSWTVINFPNSWDATNEARFEISDSSITQDVIDSYALLSFIRFTGSNTSAVSTPFISLASRYEIHDSMSIGEYATFAIVNDIGAQPEPPTNHEVRYVLIAPTNLSGKSDAPSLEKMQEIGIKTSNYRDVMDYLGLEY